VSGDDEAVRPVEMGPGDDVQPDPLDVQPWRVGAQRGLDPLGDRHLVMALRRDVDEVRSQLEQVGHPIETTSYRPTKTWTT